jgi:predicted transposase/invertase (TIGR01784 family)
MHRLKAVPEEFKGTIFERFLELGRLEDLTPEEMETYSKNALLQDIAECAHEDGMKKGMEKGRKEGKLEGIEKERIRFTKLCLRKGMSFEEIAELTELSVPQIQAIALA